MYSLFEYLKLKILKNVSFIPSYRILNTFALGFYISLICFSNPGFVPLFSTTMLLRRIKNTLLLVKACYFLFECIQDKLLYVQTFSNCSIRFNKCFFLCRIFISQLYVIQKKLLIRVCDTEKNKIKQIKTYINS